MSKEKEFAFSYIIKRIMKVIQAMILNHSKLE